MLEILLSTWLFLPHITVDLSKNYLTACINNKIVQSKVVSGKPGWETPIGVFTITTLEVNKPWWVPKSIEQDLPHRTYNNHKGNLYQPAGPDNEMGQLSLPFDENRLYALHGTPYITNFWRPPEGRYLSHGCVRVKQISQLVNILLRLPHEPDVDINTLLAGSDGKYEHVTVTFKTPIVVTIKKNGRERFPPNGTTCAPIN